MKKLVFMFVAFAAISFASCGSKTETPANNDSTTVSDSDSCCTSDSDSVKACCDSMQADTTVKA